MVTPHCWNQGEAGKAIETKAYERMHNPIRMRKLGIPSTWFETFHTYGCKITETGLTGSRLLAQHHHPDPLTLALSPTGRGENWESIVAFLFASPRWGEGGRMSGEGAYPLGDRLNLYLRAAWCWATNVRARARPSGGGVDLADDGERPCMSRQ